MDGSPTMRGLAWGRIALGSAALAAPNVLARSLGIVPDSQVAYLTRVFGSRAIALGALYLMSDTEQQTRAHPWWLLVDAGDTVAGIGHAVRKDLPVRATAPLVALTGTYALCDVAALLSDRAR